jgi:hypothetical protein
VVPGDVAQPGGAGHARDTSPSTELWTQLFAEAVDGRTIGVELGRVPTTDVLSMIGHSR